MTTPAIYALDIETDTAATPLDPAYPAGLDPRAAAITSVAVYSPQGALVLDDPDERRMLTTLRDWLHDVSTATGVIATWNGACFDLPYLNDRAARLGVELGLVLEPSDERPPKYEALPGHAGGYKARFGRHDHVDIAYAFKQWALERNISWSLKPVATAHGIPVITVDREHMESLSVAERMAYNLSDVVATHTLAVLLGDRLGGHVDAL